MDSRAFRGRGRPTARGNLTFAYLVSSHRFLNCAPSVFDRSNFVPTPLDIVEILRIDLQHDDDNVQVHFLPGRLPPDRECLSVSCMM